MLTANDYRAMDALDLAAAQQAREISCEEATRAAIAVAEERNPQLNAIVHEAFEQAIDQARHLDRQPLPGPLSGTPFLIKDLSPMAGLPVGFGSRLYDGHVADRNGAIVEAFLRAGVVVLGKSATPEFGLTLTTEPAAGQPCRNPWNPLYSAGGSSGGAAAAVAAGMVPAAHASDGGGSIRVPASCCGIVGLKPSRGLTPSEDRLAESWSGMSAGHVVSRSVRDSAAFLDVIAVRGSGRFPRPPADAGFLATLQRPPPPLRLGLQTSHPLGGELSADCLAAVRQAGKLCAELGHTVEEIAAPVDYKPAVAAMGRIICLHTAQAVAPRLASLGLDLDSDRLERSTRAMVRLGQAVTADEYMTALDTLHRTARAMARCHEQYPVLLSPVLSQPPAPLGWLDMNAANEATYTQRFRAYGGFTALYNGTGAPSMSLPLHRSAKGLPVGVMFSAAWGADALLLRLARQLEQAAPWDALAPAQPPRCEPR